MSDLPTGTVTFLFTDLEGSTRLWEQQPEAMKGALARHDALLTTAVEAHDGRVVKSTGDGLHAVFATADAAIAAAVAGQQALRAASFEPIDAIRVRMGLHTGVAEQRAGDYFGPVLNRAARLMAVAHPGQVLCSQPTADLVLDSGDPAMGFTELGRHRLRDLTRPEIVFQVTHPDIPADFPPLRTLDAFPGNLPIERTTLIGRADELARLGRALETHRLVTLTGVGGVGKTRLALQLAADVLDNFPDGAWLVALATIRDPDLVPSAVATAMEIAERPGRPLHETVRDTIGTRQLLIVLDNCEHLLDPTARLVDELLDTCPAIRIVATSREAFGVEGEQVWPTPSLRLPGGEAPASLEELAQADAVALFVERARAVQPDFQLSADNAAAVVGLCRRLDGIPLAIELAAARVSALGPRDILDRIDQRFLLLTGGSRTALERHQTLQAAVDWSYELLDEDERRLFERLSVFVGGFTLEAAVAGAADDDQHEVEVLDMLSRLVGKSMVIADRSGESVRYQLLETLRQYGRDRLAASGDATRIRARHSEYFLAYAETVQAALMSPDQALAWDRLNLETGNIRSTFNWLLETGAASSALALTGAGFVGWSETGELLRLREAALEAAASLPSADLVRPMAQTAYSAMNTGEPARATELAEASLARARDVGIAPHSLAYEVLGVVALWANDPTKAVEMLDRAVSLARTAADDRSTSIEFGEVDARVRLTAALSTTCFALTQTGDTERAVRAGEEALEIARDLEIPTLLSSALFNLALACQASDPVRAAHLIDEALECSIGERAPMARCWVLVAAGQVRTTLGEHEAALEFFGEVLALARTSGERYVVPVALQGMARALRHQGRLDEAATVLGAAQGLADRLGIAGGPLDVGIRDRAARRLRDLLGTQRFDEAWETGQALTFDGALTLAIDIAASTRSLDSTPPFSAGGSPERNVFHRDGDTWTVSYRGATVRLRDAKGLRYLARLLAQPGREVHVSDLAAESTGGEQAPLSGSGGEALDAAATQAYRLRLAELEADVTEATEWNDPERAARAQAEIDALTEQLAGAYGLGDRTRTLADPAERIRKAVTNRIRDSIARIDRQHEALGRHLANAVHTGTFCCYRPQTPTAWELAAGP